MTLYYAILALVLLVVDYRITNSNMGVVWNGYGSIKGVLKGDALAPMQYRVFTPWLAAVFGKSIPAYLMIKYISLFFMLVSFDWWLKCLGLDALLGTTILAATLPITILFDYHDSYWEIGFLALAFGIIYTGGNIWILAIVSFFASLNRESAVLVPVGMILTGNFLVALFLAAIVGIGLVVPRLVYGYKTRYCEGVMFKKNLISLRERWNNFIMGDVHALMIIIAFVVVAEFRYDVIANLWPFIITMALFILMVGIPGLWRETRIFGPVSLVMIPMFIGGK